MEIAIYLLAAFNTVLLINVAIDTARIRKMDEKIRLIEKNVGDLNFLINKLVNKLCEIIGTKDGDDE